MVSTLNNMVKVVVFDCDGVMFDTENANRMYYNTILLHFKRPPLSQDQFVYVHMSTVKEAIAFLFNDREDLTDVFDFCKTMSYDPLIPHMRIEPNLMPLLSGLKSHYKTAIATNRSNTMPAVLNHFKLDPFFDMVVTSLDVENPKPHPEQLIKIMNHFHAKPDEILYIGDSKTDEQAANKARVLFVSFNNPSLEAHYHVRDLKEVETLLNL
ncbi:MAG: HAD family hydrolase [Proteobacteria bacterium]|nr:HAD family hydrolase [Pseudomonadota bacterium]